MAGGLLAVFGISSNNANASITPEKGISNAISEATPLYLMHAKDVHTGIKNMISWHYSHSSHESHWSHQSHYSHYSG